VTPTQLGLLVVLGFCFLASGFLSGSETAVVAIPRERLDQLRNNGRRGQRLAALADDAEGTIGTILVANNFVNILAATIATVLATELIGEPLGPVLATFGMTALILVAGEITPKTMASRDPEAYGLFASVPLFWLRRVLTPVSRVFMGVSRGLLRPTRWGFRREAPEVTEDDIRALAAMGLAVGGIGEGTHQIIDALFAASDRPVREVMTPRVDVVSLRLPLDVDAIREVVAETGHSRFPVLAEEGSLDDLVGVLYVKDVLRSGQAVSPAALRSLVRTPQFVPESAALLDALRDFRVRRIGYAIVLDEHGGFDGLITAKDLVGELIGDLRDEFDPGSPSIVAVSEGLWIADGRIPYEAVADAIGEEFPDGPYATLAGLFLAEHGSIPQPGDRATVGGVELVVDHMDRNRIATMRVVRA
jgi:CBS domain containing-hemolysin-like protein